MTAQPNSKTQESQREKSQESVAMREKLNTQKANQSEAGRNWRRNEGSTEAMRSEGKEEGKPHL